MVVTKEEYYKGKVFVRGHFVFPKKGKYSKIGYWVSPFTRSKSRKKKLKEVV